MRSSHVLITQGKEMEMAVEHRDFSSKILPVWSGDAAVATSTKL
jgi:hypothetical protein